MTVPNGQVADAIAASKVDVRQDGIHYDELYKDTKLLLYAQDWQTDRIITSITPKIDTLIRTIRWGTVTIGGSLIANLSWELVRFFYLH